MLIHVKEIYLVSRVDWCLRWLQPLAMPAIWHSAGASTHSLQGSDQGRTEVAACQDWPKAWQAKKCGNRSRPFWVSCVPGPEKYPSLTESWPLNPQCHVFSITSNDFNPKLTWWSSRRFRAWAISSPCMALQYTFLYFKTKQTKKISMALY